MKSLSQYEFDQTTPVSTVCGRKNILKEQGNIKIEALYKIITKKNGAPDLLAIDIYLEARSWFKPKKTKVDGNVIYSSKLKGDGWQIGYEYFVKKYRCSSDLVRTKFVLLEKLGLLTRKFKTEYFYGKRFNNLMHLLVWKDTPHFYSETGLAKPLSNTPENQGHLCLNSRTPILKNKDNIYVIPNNHPMEEKRELKELSLFSSKKEKRIKKKKDFSNKLHLTKSPCATGSFGEPAQDDFSRNENKAAKESETTQMVTNCNHLNQRQYPRLLNAKEEKDRHLQRMQRTPENQGDPNFAELMSRALNHLSSTDADTEQETPMKQEKIQEGNDAKTNQMLLSKAIFNAFGDRFANEIQDNCEFRFSSPDKLSIGIKDGFFLEERQRAKIRDCGMSVYGENIKIVASLCSPVVMPIPSQAVTTKSAEVQNAAVVSVFPQRTNSSAKWLKFKANLASCFNSKHDPKYSEHIIKNWYDKLRLSPESHENTLVLIGSEFNLDRISQDYFERTEEAALASGVNIELRYECNRQKPILISRATISR